MHVSGEQLMKLTGLAAILRYPLPDLEDQGVYIILHIIIVCMPKHAQRKVSGSPEKYF